MTDARARHLLQVCEHLDIAVPEKLSVIGIDNEELTRYLSRVALSSVVQEPDKWGIGRPSYSINVSSYGKTANRPALTAYFGPTSESHGPPLYGLPLVT